MADQPIPDSTPTPASASSPKPMQKYLDKALEVLDRFGIVPKNDAPTELARLLEEVRHVDEAKVLAIAKTIRHMETFNEMVRDNVENIDVGQRYMQITAMFDSIREDSKRLIEQLDDGKIGFGEKMSNLWMKIRRGTPSDRFDDISEIYKDVANDTKDQLEREDAIMDGYIEFRFALKEAEIAARDLLEAQKPTLAESKTALSAAQKSVDDFKGDEADRSRLELTRDEAIRKHQDEDRCYQLLKDVAENLSIGYDVGETLITKLKQTHDAKDQVFRRSVTFFTTNEHVFTILSAVYTSQHGLHEATQSVEALKEGVNKGLEDVAVLGEKLEREALKAGYGSTINPKSVQKLVNSITDYQVESRKLIEDLRDEADENAKEIRRIVEEGKTRYERAVSDFARGD